MKTVSVAHFVICVSGIMFQLCQIMSQNAPIVREWVGLRPTRKTLRVEQELMKFPSGNLQVTVLYVY